jgi:hypothetical protein
MTGEMLLSDALLSSGWRPRRHLWTSSAVEQLHAYQLAIEAVGSIDARSVADELTKLATQQPS